MGRMATARRMLLQARSAISRWKVSAGRRPVSGCQKRRRRVSGGPEWRRRQRARKAVALLPGLPDCVVVEEVVPRLAWYVRPVLRAVSRPWKCTMDAEVERLRRRTRHLTLPRLLPGVLLSYRDDRLRRRLLEVLDASDDTWHALPPLPAGARKFECRAGVVRATWESDWSIAVEYELDIAGGLWWWTGRVKFHNKWRTYGQVVMAPAREDDRLLRRKMGLVAGSSMLALTVTDGGRGAAYALVRRPPSNLTGFARHEVWRGQPRNVDVRPLHELLWSRISCPEGLSLDLPGIQINLPEVALCVFNQ